MPIFAIIAPAANASLDAAVEEHFKDGRFYKIVDGQYLVSGERLTTATVTDMLGISEGKVGRALVLPVLNYKGWHVRDMWEWIASQSPQLPPAPAAPAAPGTQDE